MKRILFCIILIVCSVTVYGNNFIREYCADDEYNIEKVLSQDNEKYICLSSKYDIGDFTIKWKGYRIWCYDTITKSVLWEYPLIGEFPGYYGRINADINWYKDNIVISWFTENADSLYQHFFIVDTDGEIKKSTVHFSYKINYGNLGYLDWHVVDCHDDYSAILLESYAWGAVYITRVVQDSIVDKFTLYKNNDVQNDMDKVFSVFNKFSTKINDNLLLSSNHQLGLLDYSIILRKDMNSVTDIDGGDSILTHFYLYQKFPKFSILDSFIIKFPSELSIDNYFKFLDKNYLQIVSESHNQENFQTDYSCIYIYNIENKILKKVSEQNFAIPIDIGFDVNHKYISSYCNLFPMYIHDTLKVVRYENDKIVEVFKLDTFLTTYRSHNLYGGYKLISMDGLDTNNINRRSMYVLDSNYKVKWHTEENNKYTYKNIIPDKDKNIFWILNNTFEGLEIMKFDIFQLKNDTYNISRASFWQVDYHIPEIQNRIIFNSEKSNIVTECSSEILVWDNNSTLIKDHNLEKGFLNVYPNPSKDILYFDKELDKIDQILLTDIQGRTSSMTITSNKVDLYSFPAGMYILQLVYKNGNMANAKFVKQ